MSSRSPNAKPSRHYQAQILSGAEVTPHDDPWARASGKLPMTLLQRNFLMISLALLVIGAVLLWMGLAMLSTVPFFLLALLLIAGRFVF